MKTAEEFMRRLLQWNACEPARDWAVGKTDKEAWEQCENGAWLLWWAAIEGQDDLRSLILAKARCAKLVVHLMKDQKSIDAVRIAELFGLGKVGLKKLDEAHSKAYDSYFHYAHYSNSPIDYRVAAAAYHATYVGGYHNKDCGIDITKAAHHSSAADYATCAIAYSEHKIQNDFLKIKSEALKTCADIVRANIKPLFI